MHIKRGEKRLMAVDFTNLLAEGDSVASTPAVTIVRKRGRGATSLLSTPAPYINGSQVRFWVDAPADTTVTLYLITASCLSANGERLSQTAPLIVQ